MIHKHEVRPGVVVPYYAPCRELSIGDPLRWLKLGWQDFKRTTRHSLAYGSVFVLIGWLLVCLAWIHADTAFIVSLVLSFMIMGPVLCFGLYDTSRQLEKNRTPSFSHQLKKILHQMRYKRLFATMLSNLIVCLIIMLSVMIGIEFSASGQSTGAYALVFLLITMIFIGLAFCASALALPMILDQDTDGATAMLSSINAVLRNKLVLTLWGLLIFVLTAVGFATAMIGLAFTTPVLGYGAWHAYRDTIITNE